MKKKVSNPKYFPQIIKIEDEYIQLLIKIKEIKMREKPGDIFSIQLSNGQFGFGQILWKNGLALRIGVFKYINDKASIEIKQLTSTNFLIIENTVRTFFKLKRWTIIGHIPSEIKENDLPIYKVHTLEKDKLMNINGQIIADVNATDTNYEYHKSFSPITFANTLEVYFNIKENDEYYKKLIRE